MLQNDIVADFLTQEFNKVAEKYGRKIAIHDGAYDHDNFRAYINGIITLQSPEVLPIMNYVNMSCRYSLDFNLSLLGGFSRLNNINDIIDKVMLNINGKLIDIAGGQAIFMLRLPSTSDLQIREVIGQSVIPKVIVEVEYSVRTGGTKYQMALIDTVFDNGSVNTRWFPSQTEQIEYYNNKVTNGGAPYCDLMTPNLNSLTLNKQVYINDLRYYPQGTTKPLDASEILLKNYAIIRSLDETGQATSYYYYYVTSATINSNNQISLDLQLDTVQTYYFNPSIEFSDCRINRAHLNRFIDNGDGTVSFDGTETSCLFETENMPDLPKRLTKRTKLHFISTGSTKLDEWIKENVLYWVYVFIDKKHQYKIYSLSDSEKKEENTNPNFSYISHVKGLSKFYKSEYGVLCYPITKTGYEGHLYIQRFNPNWKIELCENGLDSFKEMNEGASYFYNIKYSIVPSFYNVDDEDVLVTVNGATITEKSYTPTEKKPYGILTSNVFSVCTSLENNYGLIMRLEQDMEALETEEYEIETNFNFSKNEIINKDRNINLNPKLNSAYFKNLTISTNGGEKFEYDIQKINNKNVKFLYSEPIQNEITKSYLRLKGPLGLYTEGTNYNYTGSVDSVDNSVAIVNVAYDQYIANNKNFWMQSNFKIVENAGKTIIGGALAGGFVGGLVSGTVGALTTLFDRKLTIDNLKASPSQLKNASGNIIFNFSVDDLGIYIEEYNCLDNEAKSFDEYMYTNGFSFERTENIKEFDHIRKYFNFVQAEVENIVGISISNNAREDLRQRFRNGVRFWNSDNIQYDLENYEIWLENSN